MVNLKAQRLAMERRKTIRWIKVGVFPHDDRHTRFNAYTTWYNPQWKGCCEHEVAAYNGTEAKRLAIEGHKLRCVPDTASPKERNS